VGPDGLRVQVTDEPIPLCVDKAGVSILITNRSGV
jgi:hypothetical protein